MELNTTEGFIWTVAIMLMWEFVLTMIIIWPFCEKIFGR